MSPAALPVRTTRDELGEVVQRMLDISDLAKQEDRDLTAQEREEVNALDRRGRLLSAKLPRAETFDDLVRQIKTAPSSSAGSTSAAPPIRGESLGARVLASAEFEGVKAQLPTAGTYARKWELSGAPLPLLWNATQVPPPSPALFAPVPAPDLVGPLRVSQLLPHVAVSESTISYWQYTDRASGAAIVPTGGLKPTATLPRVKKSGTINVVAEVYPVDDIDLLDAPALQASINSELAIELLRELDEQILLANGVAPNWMGLVPGATGPTTDATGLAPLDAINAAAAAVATASGRLPDAVVMSPTTYAASVAVKASTAGIYLIPPVTSPARMFPGSQLRLALAPAMANGTALIGDFSTSAKLDTMGGLRAEVGNVGDSFARNQSWLRVELLCYLAILRPKAFATISNLPGGA